MCMCSYRSWSRLSWVDVLCMLVCVCLCCVRPGCMLMCLFCLCVCCGSGGVGMFVCVRVCVFCVVRVCMCCWCLYVHGCDMVFVSFLCGFACAAGV
jgi:hypothetical protein